jgi:hypothetical protein
VGLDDRTADRQPQAEALDFGRRPDALHSLRASMEEQYGRLLGQEDFLAFLASLRSRLGVEVNEAAIIADAAS